MKLDLLLSRSPGLSARQVPARSSFQTWLEAALRGARRRRATELSIRLVDAEEGRALNREYRHRDYATNVLSFPSDLIPEMDSPMIGDLAICVPVVIREATEQGKSVRDHFAHMTVHGTLHLLGYDHEVDTDAEQMEALERKVLGNLDIADPYQDC
ncbi:rRNA maturation RNase YbeY [Dokdonella sp.]|uniref:rRNA maturation RNase YbeY n=1 Tax=Dokdonella sp. TaxID=2291710 RepID=UPI003C482835